MTKQIVTRIVFCFLYHHIRSHLFIAWSLAAMFTATANDAIDVIVIDVIHVICFLCAKPTFNLWFNLIWKLFWKVRKRTTKRKDTKWQKIRSQIRKQFLSHHTNTNFIWIYRRMRLKTSFAIGNQFLNSFFCIKCFKNNWDLIDFRVKRSEEAILWSLCDTHHSHWNTFRH